MWQWTWNLYRLWVFDLILKSSVFTEVMILENFENKTFKINLLYGSYCFVQRLTVHWFHWFHIPSAYSLISIKVKVSLGPMNDSRLISWVLNHCLSYLIHECLCGECMVTYMTLYMIMGSRNDTIVMMCVYSMYICVCSEFI